MTANDIRLAGLGPLSDAGRDHAARLAADENLPALMARAERATLAGHGPVVTYSRKVFIPLTKLCRNVCHYCTFAQAPRVLPAPFLSLDEVLAIAREGAAAGCREALFTLGEKPELRYPAARRALDELGHATTIDYLASVAREVHAQTGLMVHINAGNLDAAEIGLLRPFSVSMGLMLESVASRLCERGGPHWGCPDKDPAARLATIRTAGELAVPFTTGLLIGIGETRQERVEALLALKELHASYGHIQEIIIQNFRAKPDTKMANAPEPPLEEQLWTIAMAREIFGEQMSIQAPPNLRRDELAPLIRAGINDWGGVSPVTPDHVNPESPWPHLDALAEETRAAGRILRQRLALAPRYCVVPERWLDPAQQTGVRRATDAQGRARTDDWHTGAGLPLPAEARNWPTQRPAPLSPEIGNLLAKAHEGRRLDEAEVTRLFAAEGDDLLAILASADRLRAETVGDSVSYVVNCNINYTNICMYRCGFCAFAKGRNSEALRGPAYRLDPAEVGRRSAEAAQRGATEVCLQGGIHPEYTGQTYLDIVAAVKTAVPDMHVHAFSPLEIRQGAQTLGLPLRDYLRQLQAAGLASLPGTAAEILDDEVRAVICPDKLTTAQWLEVMREAHAIGLRSTATIMFGHVEQPHHWARHLLRVRDLQAETGGFTEFVPLPFVHMESPLWRKGRARSGPTLREAVLMHAVARLALHPLIPNIQASWVKMGPEGAALCLQAGVNDLGGTLMYESITRAAGGVNGQEYDARHIEALAASVGRPARQRTTLYRRPAAIDPPQ
jgi:FO synthase